MPFLSKKQHRLVNSNLNYKKDLFTGFVGLTIINNIIMVRLVFYGFDDKEIMYYGFY
nr:MAG TPA: hypothetical protein [Caudoviricetes sp.]